MTRDLRESKSSRRKFLHDLAAAGGLAAMTGTAGGVAVAQTAEPRQRAKPSTGYRVTAHVSKYYDKARF